ncbi:MAG: 2Fe-2S iron-sulfur cluster-binding protein [Gammaproteobacteria bacterium]|nr:2Fe-2S iron-sulfur cluster-binding protein [Gammaproteobacteria bacterium]
MSIKIKVQPSGKSFEAQPHETLLESALRSGLSPAYNCSNGSCGECRAKLISGKLGEPKFHDFNFTEADKQAGYFLLCRNCAATELEVEIIEAGSVADIPHQEVSAKVKSLEKLNDHVMLLRVRLPRSQTFRFLAGQQATINIADLEPRNKSIASCPCITQFVDFHIGYNPADPFSDYVFNQLKASDPISLSGPEGKFVLDETSSKPVIFIAFKTGFSAIKSLIEHAIGIEMTQPMHLYWLSPDNKGIYMHNYVRSWTDALDNLSYVGITGYEEKLCLEQAAEKIVTDFPDLSAFQVYMSGPEKKMSIITEKTIQHQLKLENLFIDAQRRY